MKDSMRGPAVWQIKSARVHLVSASEAIANPAWNPLTHHAPVAEPARKIFRLRALVEDPEDPEMTLLLSASDRPPRGLLCALGIRSTNQSSCSSVSANMMTNYSRSICFEIGSRRLQIVDQIYRSGRISLDELAARTGSDVDTITGDIAALRRGGLQIHLNEDGFCSMRATIPGYNFRLTDIEAADALEMCRNCSWCPLLIPPSIPDEVMATACSVFEAALRHYHTVGELVLKRQTRCIHSSEEHSRSEDTNNPIRLRGEAGRVHRRLRVFDLIEAGKANNRAALARICRISVRTISTDLGILEHAGLKIVRSCGGRLLKADTLHTHIDGFLGRPDGAKYLHTLLTLFRGGGQGAIRDRLANQREVVSNKIARSLDAILKRYYTDQKARSPAALGQVEL